VHLNNPRVILHPERLKRAHPYSFFFLCLLRRREGDSGDWGGRALRYYADVHREAWNGEGFRITFTTDGVSFKHVDG